MVKRVIIAAGYGIEQMRSHFANLDVGVEVVIVEEKEPLGTAGSISMLNKEEFDSLIYDLTNFLVYVGEPAKAQRERMGWYVIFYFLIFTALSALLYREYHKDYHK